MDIYKTPRDSAEVTFIEKRSRFIGHIWYVDNETDARKQLTQTRELHRDASHNVYAWIIRENNLIRYSDDGEPQGTAGMPVLEVLRREEITNVLCVITRYFGGILLGAPGLVRAYAHTAKLALDAAGILTWRLWAQIMLVCPYSQYEMLKYEALQCGGIIEDENFSADVTLTISIPADGRQALEERLVDTSSGMAEVLLINEEHRGM